MNYKLQTMNYELQTMNYELQTMNYKLQTMNYELQTINGSPFVSNTPQQYNIKMVNMTTLHRTCTVTDLMIK